MIHPRNVIGTPEPPATRPRLHSVNYCLAHEVGVNTPAAGRYRSTDPARVLSDARAAAAYGISAGKAWEYSYMIGLDGSAFEQAGEYVAAHCLNFNPSSGGIIFLNATDVPVNAAQIATWFEVRAHMVAVGTLAPGHVAAPHYRFRSTSCPGLRAEPPGAAWSSPTGEGRLGNLIPELLTPPTPPTPPPSNIGEVDMYVIAVTRPGWPGPVDLVIAADGTRWNANANTSNLDTLAGVPRIDNVSKDQALGILVDRHGIGRHPFAPGPNGETIADGAYHDAELANAW